MTLADIQRNFTAYLAGVGDEAVASVADRSQRGLPVYHYAYRASLTAALRDTYEATYSWLGDDQFEAAAHAYIAAFPSASWTLADFGGQFEQVLAEMFEGHPELYELAWLDWSLRTAFAGRGAGKIDASSLGDVDWDSARLCLAPTLTLREFTSNAAELWTALVHEAEDIPQARLLSEREMVMVWRDDLTPRYCTISRLEHAALIMAGDGLAFGPICEILSERTSDEDVVDMAGAMLGRWIAEGVLTDVVA